MSVRHPIISVTGSSGGGTTTVRLTFEQIFRREKVDAVFIEGDAFHRFDRDGMKQEIARHAALGNEHFSHFGPECNLLQELESTFDEYGRQGTGRTRHYVHDDEEAARLGSPPGTFTDWHDFPADERPALLRGLHGAVVTDECRTSPAMPTSGSASCR